MSARLVPHPLGQLGGQGASDVPNVEGVVVWVRGEDEVHVAGAW